MSFNDESSHRTYVRGGWKLYQRSKPRRDRDVEADLYGAFDGVHMDHLLA